jgi:uncharacterized membrane protein YfhO
MTRYLLVLILLGALLSAPILIHGLPDISNDAHNHAAWSENFAQQFWAGDLYPRWLTNMNAGYGSPAFFFYPPLHSFVSTLFWPLVRNSQLDGWRISGYSCVLATLLAGITSWFWLRSFTNSFAALVGAVVYMVAPYHLAIDLYNRGAAAEYWTFVWLPLVMLSADRIVRRCKYGVVCLAITYALCVLSHAAVAACFAAVPVAYVLVFSDHGSRIRSVGIACGGLLAGIGLTAPFLLPAVFDQKKAYLSAYPGDYGSWWLFSIRDKITDATTQLTHIPWYFSFKMRIAVITVWMVLFVLFLYTLTLKNASENLTRRRAGFFAAATLICLFLMTSQSDFIWRLIPSLRWLQFPYRLNTVIVLASAALTGLALEGLSLRRNRISFSIVALSLVGFLSSTVVSAEQAFSKWRHISAERLSTNAQIVKTQMEATPFWPKPARASDLRDVSAFDRFIAENPPKAVTFTAGAAGDATIATWHPRAIELTVHCSQAGQIILNHFYYEGWRASRGDTKDAIALTASQPDGFIDLTVPTGSYNLLIEYPPDGAEKAGRVIGLLSLAVCIGLFGYSRSRQNHTLFSSTIAPQTAASSAD